MKYKVQLQDASSCGSIPDIFSIQRWVDETLSQRLDTAELVIRVVNEDEMAELNKNYRKKSGPTNILSFPADFPDDIIMDHPLLGDLIICGSIIEKEAKEQQKPILHHWAHIIIHGLLHLLGYDHEDDKEAEEMEAIEITILKKLHIPNPYIIQEHKT